MFQTRGEKGKDLISRAGNVFKMIADDLAQGVEHCKSEIERHNSIIATSKGQIVDMNFNISKAEKIQKGLAALTD